MARKRRQPQARGWYEKKGDPPGTERFWDGEKWGPNPRYKRGAEPAAAKQKPDAKTELDAGSDESEMEATDTTELTQSSVWARISGRSADIVILVIPLYWLLVRAYASETVELADGTSDVVLTTNLWYLVLAAVLVIAYDAGFTSRWGATPGKRLMGLMVADKDTLASPPGWQKAVLRAIPLAVVVAPLLVPVLWLASVAAMFFDRRQQRSVFDLSAGTLVVLDPSRPQRAARSAK